MNRYTNASVIFFLPLFRFVLHLFYDIFKGFFFIDILRSLVAIQCVHSTLPWYGMRSIHRNVIGSLFFLCCFCCLLFYVILSPSFSLLFSYCCHLCYIMNFIQIHNSTEFPMHVNRSITFKIY